MKPIKDMDCMDVDQVVDVPDTPDRLATQNTNGRGFMEKESDSSVASHSGNTDFIEEGARNQLRARKKLVIDNGHSSRPSFHLGKKLGISHKSECGDVFTILPGNSSSSKSHNLFRRMAADKNANHENKKYSHCEPKEKGKALCASQSSTFVGNDVVDLMEHSGHAQVLQKAFPNRASEGRQIKETRKGPISVNGFSPSRGIANPSTVAHIPYKGKEKLDGACKEGPGIDRGKGIVVDSQPKAGQSMSASLNSIPSPRARGQKRLVRNGCISPYSPAKAKQLVENPSNGSSDVQNDKGAPVSDCSSSLIRELIAEDNNSHRRKGVLRNLFSSEEPDTKTTNYSTRHSLTRNEEAGGTSNANGWRSTHNRTKQVNLPLSDEGQHFSRTKSDQCFVTPQNNNSMVRRDNGNGSSIRLGNNHHDGTNAVSSQHGSTPTVSHLLNSDLVSGHFTTASSLMKRQKQSSASSNRRETSTSVSMDSEIVFLGSSGEPSNSRSTNNQNSRRILDPIIEIEEFSPERRCGSHNIGRSSDPDSRSRARQLEADEMLARELQEQLYNEGPGVADGEIDAHIALALQQEETSQYAFSNGSPPIFRPRAPVISNFNRQSQTRTSQYPSIRRGTQVRGRASTRLTRLRSRLPPSQSARISHGERRSIFAPGMDLDTRMHILETLEAFSDMGVTGNFLQAEHEFNVNDYETLLALDENNHQHGGASLNQINILPESTVQGDNYDETCAICLETPTTGDAIRHLPCLHKFHKDCIDPWLRRRPSCPVCKFSITS